MPERSERGCTPLAGVNIVDITHILAGPYASMLLADAGADVVKVEPPWGEYARVRGAIRSGPNGATLSAYSAAVHRGKRSIALDLKSTAGASVLQRLIDRADVVVENLAPGALNRLGFDFDELRKKNPRLITCSISLFGTATSARDYARRGGLAIIAEAESGLIAMNRQKDGTPRQFSFGLGDTASGLSAYGGIVTALYNRERLGSGGHIDIAMVRTLLSFNGHTIAGQDIGGEAGTDFRTAALGVFESATGYVAIGVNSDSLWRRLAGALDSPELADDARYAGYEERDHRVDEVNDLVSAWTRGRSSADIVDCLSGAGIPCGHVKTAADVLDGGMASELGFLQEIPDGLGGHVRVPGSPIGLPPSGGAIPRCGEHTEEILRELGLSETDTKELAERGAFG